MWTVISICFVVVTSIFGITELLRMGWLYLMRPKGDPPHVLVVFLKDDICIQQLRAALEYITWEGRNLFSCIAAIDCSLSEEKRLEVGKMADRYSNILFGDAALEECLSCYQAQQTED